MADRIIYDPVDCPQLPEKEYSGVVVEKDVSVEWTPKAETSLVDYAEELSMDYYDLKKLTEACAIHGALEQGFNSVTITYDASAVSQYVSS